MGMRRPYNLGIGVPPALPEDEMQAPPSDPMLSPRDKLYQELREKAERKKAEAAAQMQQNTVTEQDLGNLTESMRNRGAQEGLQSAANKFLSIGGEAPKSGIGQTLEGFNKADAMDLQGKKDRYAEAGKQYTAADNESWDATTRPLDLQSKEGAIKAQNMAYDLSSLNYKNEQAINDPNSAESQNARFYFKMATKKEPPPNASAKQLQGIIPLIEKAQANERADQTRRDEMRFKNMEFGLRRAELTQKQAEAKAAKEKEATDKKNRENAELGVAEWDLDPTGKIRPAQTEAVKARAAQAALKDLRQQVTLMRDLVGKYGSNIMTGPEAASAGSLATQMRLNYKTIKELGAITGPDMALLEQVIPNPNDWGQLFVSNDSAKSKIDELSESSEREFKNKMASLGYSQTQKKAPPPIDPEDQKALAWANANGNHPKAKEIMKELSQKYGN